MTTPTHYFNFKPCEAVQFQESGPDQNIALVCEWLGADPAEDYEFFDAEYEAGLPSGGTIYYDNENEQASPGQRLIRQDGKVWVQDEEPPRVKEWEYAKRPHNAASGLWFKCERDKATHCRPVLSNGWEGPWEAVDGDS